MPTYTYKREDGSLFEVEQRITEEPLVKCPTTGQAVKRVISGGAGLVFKGSGFYLTDYKNSASPSGGDSSTKEDAKSSAPGSDAGSSDSPSKKESTSKASASDD